MQLTIDALKDAAAWPGTGQRTLAVPASQPMAAEAPTGRAIRPQNCIPGAGPVNGKETS